jgi:hypothetical protein
MIGIGTAGEQVDVIVWALGLAWINTVRDITADRLPLRRLNRIPERLRFPGDASFSLVLVQPSAIVVP